MDDDWLPHNGGRVEPSSRELNDRPAHHATPVLAVHARDSDDGADSPIAARRGATEAFWSPESSTRPVHARAPGPAEARDAVRRDAGQHGGDTHGRVRASSSVGDSAGESAGEGTSEAGFGRVPSHSRHTPSPSGWQMARVSRYLEYCAFYRVPALPEACAAFRFPRIRSLGLAGASPRDMLPLGEMLRFDNVITHIDCHKAVALGNVGAYVLADVLTSNTRIVSVDLSGQDVGEHGAVALARAVAQAPCLTHMNLRGNRIGVAGARAFAKALLNTRSLAAPNDPVCGLTYLDLSNNYLRVEGVREITRSLVQRARLLQHALADGEDSTPGEGAPGDTRVGCCGRVLSARDGGVRHGGGYGWLWGEVSELVVCSDTTVRTNFHHQRGTVAGASTRARSSSAAQKRLQPPLIDVEVRVSGNFMREEVTSSVVHGTGTVAAVAAAIPLLTHTQSIASGDSRALVSAAAYTMSTVAFFLSATLNHSLFLTDVSAVFRLIDHAAVYALIAGTYSPFLALNYRHVQPYADILGMAVWTLAVVGVLISTLWPASAMQRRLRVMLYLAMGWMAAIPSYLLHECIRSSGWLLLGFGGVVFSTGVGLYVRTRTSPRHELHVLWYIFVLLAATLHWFAVYNFAEWPSEQCLEASLARGFTTRQLVSSLSHRSAAASSPSAQVFSDSASGVNTTALFSIFDWNMPRGPPDISGAGAALSAQFMAAAAALADVASAATHSFTDSVSTNEAGRVLRAHAVTVLKNLLAQIEPQNA